MMTEKRRVRPITVAEQPWENARDVGWTRPWAYYRSSQIKGAAIFIPALGHFPWRAMDMCDRPPFDWTKQLGYLPALQVTGPSGQEDGWDERWTKQGEEMSNLYLRLFQTKKTRFP